MFYLLKNSCTYLREGEREEGREGKGKGKEEGRRERERLPLIHWFTILAKVRLKPGPKNAIQVSHMSSKDQLLEISLPPDLVSGTKLRYSDMGHVYPNLYLN